MERRSFITTLAAAFGSDSTTLKGETRLVLLVRPQDVFDWIIRTTNGLAYRHKESPEEIQGVLRVDRSSMRLYFRSGDPALPKIDLIDVDPALASAPRSTWRIVERRS